MSLIIICTTLKMYAGYVILLIARTFDPNYVRYVLSFLTVVKYLA